MAIDANQVLQHGAIEVVGKLAVASNATLFVRVGDEQMRAVYKPIAGEQPLWDFPDQTLALREVAAFRTSELLGWEIVPFTCFRDGPYGEGAVQRWIDVDPSIDLVALAQSDHPRLAQIALFDAVVNNTDRKISHLLPDGHDIYGCDHGVTFHAEDKLRTVLWQWRGSEIPQTWLNDLERMTERLLRQELSELLADEEIDALVDRIERLLSERRFPFPSEEWPPVPWPPF